MGRGSLVTITPVAGIAWFASQGADPGLGGSDSGGGTAHTAPTTTTTISTAPTTTAPTTTGPSSATTTVAPRRTTGTRDGVASGCRSVDRSRPDVDGDGCGDDVRIEHDVVVAGFTRYRVGRVGDPGGDRRLDCDGTSTIAVLRPEDGTVHVFDRCGRSTAIGRRTRGASDRRSVDRGPADGCGCTRVTRRRARSRPSRRPGSSGRRAC